MLSNNKTLSIHSNRYNTTRHNTTTHSATHRHKHVTSSFTRRNRKGRKIACKRLTMAEMRSMIKQLQASLAAKDRKFDEMMTTMRDMMTSQTTMMNTITQLTAQISASAHASNGIYVGHAPLQAMTATTTTPSSAAFSAPKPRPRTFSTDGSQPSMDAFIHVGRQSHTPTTTTAVTTTSASVLNDNIFHVLPMNEDETEDPTVSAETGSRMRSHSSPSKTQDERPHNGSVPSSAQSLIASLTTPSKTHITAPRKTTKRVRANSKA